MRSAAEKRHNDYIKALRKRRIDRETAPREWGRDWYDNLHQYSKNKIHCSCPLCACKTNNRKGRCLGPRNNWSIQDKRNLEKLNYEEDDE